MKTYEIIHLETGKVLQTRQADGFTVDEHGIVIFYEQPDKMVPRNNVGTTQVSASTLVAEKKAPKPALVMPLPEEQCEPTTTK